MATNRPRVSVTVTADASGYTAAIGKAKAQLLEFSTASKRAHGSMVSDVQATSGALRVLEGGMTGNIRAAERFLASFKGLSAALQAIYPAVGLVAVGAVISRGVTELSEFIKKTKEASAEFQAGLEQMINSSRLNNDELAKTNVELENQIAKLTGKHENVLAAQMIEARIETDKLAMSAAQAAKEMHDLLEKNQAGLLGQLLGKGATADAFGNIENFQNLKAQARQDQEDANHRGDKTAEAAAEQRFQQTLKNERAWLQTNLKGYQSVNGGAGGDYSATIQAIRAALDLNYQQSDRIDLDKQHATDAGQLKKLQDAKNIADKAREAAEKAAREMKQSMDDQLASMRQDHLVGIAEEAEYWQNSLKAVKGGSAPMLALRVEINKRLADLSQEQRRNLERFQNERLPESIRPESSAADIHEMTDTAKEQADANEKAARDAARTQAAYAASVVDLKLASGLMSKLAASQELAQIHAKQFAEEIAAIQGTMKFWQSGPATAEGNRHIDEATRQIADLTNAARQAAGQDQAAINANTPLGAWKESLDQFVQMSRDTASQIREIWSSSLAAVNEEIVKIISTRHNYGVGREFGNIGAGIFRNVAGAGLSQLEGGLLNALGFGGKPDGSQGKPFHVILAGAGSVKSSVASAASGIGGWLGKVGGFFTGLGFADGGMPPVGMASLVGERGPELFVPRTAGTIVPNSALGSAAHMHNWNIDARGATDPAAVKVMVQRGIAEAMPAITAVSMRVHRETQARLPSSRR